MYGDDSQDSFNLSGIFKGRTIKNITPFGCFMGFTEILEPSARFHTRGIQETGSVAVDIFVGLQQIAIQQIPKHKRFIDTDVIIDPTDPDYTYIFGEMLKNLTLAYLIEFEDSHDQNHSNT
jgi:hypothetical protein